MLDGLLRWTLLQTNYLQRSMVYKEWPRCIRSLLRVWVQCHWTSLPPHFISVLLNPVLAAGLWLSPVPWGSHGRDMSGNRIDSQTFCPTPSRLKPYIIGLLCMSVTLPTFKNIHQSLILLESTECDSAPPNIFVLCVAHAINGITTLDHIVS